MIDKGIVSCCSKVFDPGPPVCNTFSSFSSATHQLVLSVSAPLLSSSPIKVLIDSGCTHSFIDQRLINLSKHKVSKFGTPIALRLFDGSVVPSGPISMFADINFSFPDSATDRFQSLVTRLDPSVSMALGYDWLLARNPMIDWRLGQIIPHDLSTANFPDNGTTSAESGASSVLALAPVPPTISSILAPVQPPPQKMSINIEIISAAAFAELAYDSPVIIGSINPFDEVTASSAVDETASQTVMSNLSLNTFLLVIRTLLMSSPKQKQMTCCLTSHTIIQ
jgi:hypothetical protein